MTSFSTDPRDIRKFGGIAFLLFGALFALALWRQKQFLTYFFGTLGSIGLGLLILPGPLRPLYEGWMKVAHFIGQTITLLSLALAYYLVITPSALLKRVFGGRPLPMGPDKDAGTYWITRPEPVQPKERFLKRY